MFIDWSLYMARRCLSLPGAPDLWIRLGWLQRDLSQQGLLPEVHCTACTKGAFTKTTKYQRPRALCPRGLYSWWHFASPANGNGSCDCAPVTWAYGAQCPAMVSPNAGLHKEDKLLYPDHHLIWCTKSGFRPAHGGWTSLNTTLLFIALLKGNFTVESRK